MPAIDSKTTIESMLKQRLISQRCYNCLLNAKLLTLWDIQKYVSDGHDLREIPKLGPKSEFELKNLIQNCPRRHYNPRTVGYITEYWNLDKLIKDILAKAFEKTLNLKHSPDPSEPYPMGINAYIALYYKDVDSLYNIVTRGTEKVLKIQPYLTASENIEFRLWHIGFWEEALQLMDSHGLKEHPQYDQFMAIKEDIEYDAQNFSLLDIVNHFLTEKTDKLLQKRYEELCRDRLGNESLKFLLSVLPSYKDAIGFFDKPIEEYGRLCNDRTIRRALTDTYQVVREFKELEFSSYERFLDDPERIVEKVRKDHPYLSPQESSFIADFILRHKIRPVFFFMDRFLRNSHTKENAYFAFYYGFNEQRKEYSVEEIAQLRRTTPEKVSHFLHDRLKYKYDLPLSAAEWTFYKNLFETCSTPHFITPESELFKTIVIHEHIPEDDFKLFSALCLLLLDYEINIDLGFNVLVTPWFKRYFEPKRLSKLLERFYKVGNARYMKETFIYYSYIAQGITSDYHNDLVHLLKLLTKDKPIANKIVYASNGVILGEKKLDIPAELHKILAEAGEPLSLEEIYERFKQLHPNHKYWNANQLRPYLTKVKDLVKISSRDSRYGLSSGE